MTLRDRSWHRSLFYSVRVGVSKFICSFFGIESRARFFERYTFYPTDGGVCNKTDLCIFLYNKQLDFRISFDLRYFLSTILNWIFTHTKSYFKVQAVNPMKQMSCCHRLKYIPSKFQKGFLKFFAWPLGIHTTMYIYLYVLQKLEEG